MVPLSRSTSSFLKSELFLAGDFNHGDGNSDLVWDSVEYGTYVWNLGVDGRIIGAGPGCQPRWCSVIVGCGQFNYTGVGSHVLVQRRN